jgi:hypothetical protein
MLPSMADLTKRHAVFLDFCHDAIKRVSSIHSPEADHVRAELEVLVARLEQWPSLGANPPDKEITLTKVMVAYRRSLELADAARTTEAEPRD